MSIYKKRIQLFISDVSSLLTMVAGNVTTYFKPVEKYIEGTNKDDYALFTRAIKSLNNSITSISTITDNLVIFDYYDEAAQYLNIISDKLRNPLYISLITSDTSETFTLSVYKSREQLLNSIEKFNSIITDDVLDAFYQVVGDGCLEYIRGTTKPNRIAIYFMKRLIQKYPDEIVEIQDKLKHVLLGDTPVSPSTSLPPIQLLIEDFGLVPGCRSMEWAEACNKFNITHCNTPQEFVNQFKIPVVLIQKITDYPIEFFINPLLFSRNTMASPGLTPTIVKKFSTITKLKDAEVIPSHIYKNAIDPDLHPTCYIFESLTSETVRILMTTRTSMQKKHPIDIPPSHTIDIDTKILKKILAPPETLTSAYNRIQNAIILEKSHDDRLKYICDQYRDMSKIRRDTSVLTMGIGRSISEAFYSKLESMAAPATTKSVEKLYESFIESVSPIIAESCINILNIKRENDEQLLTINVKTATITTKLIKNFKRQLEHNPISNSIFDSDSRKYTIHKIFKDCVYGALRELDKPPSLFNDMFASLKVNVIDAVVK